VAGEVAVDELVKLFLVDLDSGIVAYRSRRIKSFFFLNQSEKKNSLLTDPKESRNPLDERGQEELANKEESISIRQSEKKRTGRMKWTTKTNEEGMNRAKNKNY
jgi:hypothetical protein